MVVDLKMCRFDNVPWGFRLVGGSDFEFPLTVVKVTEGSIAEQAGLRVNDIIVRINDTAASPLTHDEAHDIIMHCGNVFYFGVQRRDEGRSDQGQDRGQGHEQDQAESAPSQFPIIGVEQPSSPESFLTLDSSSALSSYRDEDENQNQYEIQYENRERNQDDNREEPDRYLREDRMCDRPNSALSDCSERKLVEAEIAAVLSGESEVLKEHNVMGIFPKPGVCMTSDVLRTLNEEAVKTKAEKDKENKKWTTFLQKPNRPIPKSRAQLEAERRAANAYKVKIVKSAPRTPERSVSPAVRRTPEPEPQPPKEPTPPPPEPVVEEEPPTDSEVPNLEELPPGQVAANSAISSDGEEKADEEKEPSSSSSSPSSASDDSQVRRGSVESGPTEGDATTTPPPDPAPAKTPEELALERQLADVQRQLQALSSLPSTIQATLDAVTKQLGELLPTFKLQAVAAASPPRAISLERAEEEAKEETKDDNSQETRAAAQEAVDDNRRAEQEAEEQQRRDEEQQTSAEEKKEEDGGVETSGEDRDRQDFGVPAEDDPAKRQQAMERQEEMRQMEQEQTVKKQKRHDVIEELEEHLERKNHPRQRSKRAFGPLTPSSERPLVLPGGRRWYRPKDAYNDEFIAETLSAQAELITGTTLGSSYESPLLGYDPNKFHGASVALQLELDRVNFMKYQKPERKIDLDRSEVYKIIHHLDRRPMHGIEVRAPVVAAEADIRKAVHS